MAMNRHLTRYGLPTAQEAPPYVDPYNPHIEPSSPGKEKTEWGDTVVPDPTTGAKKADQGKLRLDLLPIIPLIATAKIFTFGADKYGDRNWEAGFPWNRPYAALLRHLFAWWAGEDKDPESGESHLAHAMCNLMFLMQFEQTHPELDNRPCDTIEPKEGD